MSSKNSFQNYVEKPSFHYYSTQAGAWEPIQKDFSLWPKLGNQPKLGDLTKVATCSKMTRVKLGRVGEIVLRRFA